MAVALTGGRQQVHGSRAGGSVRALLGVAVMALALGTAGAVGKAADLRFGLTGTGRQVLIAVVCAGLAVPLIVLLRRRVDRRPMSGLGLTGWSKSLRSFGLGAAAKLVEFVIVNAMIAFVLEALPEELVFRGYVYRTLNEALRRWTAFVATVVLFTFAGGASSVVYSVVSALLGQDVPAPSFAPAGEDPVAYAVLYPVFGVALLIARITTGSVWASIAVHLTYLTAVRVAYDGTARDAGWSAESATPDALLLIPALLLLTGLVFLIYARLRGDRVRWRERAPEPRDTDAEQAR